MEAAEPEVGTAEAAALVALLVTELAAPVTALTALVAGLALVGADDVDGDVAEVAGALEALVVAGGVLGALGVVAGALGAPAVAGGALEVLGVADGALEELGVADGAAAAAADPTAETAEPAALVAVDTALVTGAAALETAPVAAETSDCCPVPEEPAASAGLLARVKKVTPTRSSRQRRSLDIQG